MNTSLPFVHTARRSYRLDELVSKSEVTLVCSLSISSVFETLQTRLSRGRRSRNKVSVGEPAEGSFQQQMNLKLFNPSVSSIIRGPGGSRWSCLLLQWVVSALTPWGSFFLPFNPHSLRSMPNDQCSKHTNKQNTPFNDESLGSRNDEERGKMRKCSMNRRIS